MKKLFLLMALVLTACASKSLAVTPSMTAAMESYATSYAKQYPDEPTNTAHECALVPTAVYWNGELKQYAVTCNISDMPGVYGIVTMDEFTVISTCTVNSISASELKRYLQSVGFK